MSFLISVHLARLLTARDDDSHATVMFASLHTFHTMST
jgi:hypothetical protein